MCVVAIAIILIHAVFHSTYMFFFLTCFLAILLSSLFMVIHLLACEAGVLPLGISGGLCTIQICIDITQYFSCSVHTHTHTQSSVYCMYAYIYVELLCVQVHTHARLHAWCVWCVCVFVCVHMCAFVHVHVHKYMYVYYYDWGEPATLASQWCNGLVKL